MNPFLTNRIPRCNSPSLYKMDAYTSSSMSSEADDSEGKTSSYCFMHAIDTHGRVIPFSEKSFNKFLECSTLWKELENRPESVIASKADGLQFDDVCTTTRKRQGRAGYHVECYRHFCNLTSIRRAKDKSRKAQISTEVDGVLAARNLQETSDAWVEPEPKRLLRSDATSSPCPGRPHVLPIECVICKSTKYVKESFSQKRKVERLIRCETLSGGQLVKAAEIRNDEKLLLKIRGKDLVALEVRYHRSCYLCYCRVVKPKVESDVHLKQSYVVSYVKFCQNVIERRIIRGQEILRLTKLLKLFVKTVKEVEGLEAANYKSANLKRRLKESYPVLCFSRPSRQYESEIVFVESLGVEDVIESAVVDVSSEESQSESDGSMYTTKQVRTDERSLRTLYAAAQIIKTSLDDMDMKTTWPPTYDDLNITQSKKLIPWQLFNFLGWMSGVSHEPREEKVTVSTDDERKVLSIAQDIVYLKTKGRCVLPKHHALGMSVRHLTGSAKLIGILNGLGHSVSRSVVLAHDTALAKRQLALGDQILPDGVQPIFTTLVYDNNDFGEETVSGKGTTHNTNGIIVQHPITQPEREPSKIAIPKSRKIAFEVPPVELVTYFGRRKIGPQPFDRLGLECEEYQDAQRYARDIDIACRLLKTVEVGEKLLPGWTGMNVMLTKPVSKQCTVGYLPIIDASPTEFDTVNTILTTTLSIADALKQESVVLVFDQAIYSKAQQIRWVNEIFRKRIVIRLGAFHTALSMLACIGKRFGDAGLENLMIESNIVAQGSINGVISGHHYNRSIRAHKCIMEAMERLRWQAYISSLSDVDYASTYEILAKLQSDFPTSSFTEFVRGEEFQAMASSYRSFVKQRSTQDPTFALWSSYIEMVEVILLFLRATRQGDWQLHLSSIRSFLPWFFAYDRTNYARYLPAYWHEMSHLPNSHPLIYKAFMEGKFVVHRQTEHGFCGVACDQTIEQTCNRDTKTKGGMIGFTRNKGAVARWLLSQHERSAISKQCEEMAGKDHTSALKKDLTVSNMEKVEGDVCAVVETVEAMINPFQENNEELLHLASGVIASADVCKDYTAAYTSGDEAFKTFCEERLQGDGDLFKVLKKQKRKSFATMNKASTTKVKGKEVTIKADRNLFQRLVIIAGARKLDIRNMMTYNLGPLPLALATIDGSLTKTTKASLLHAIESSVEPAPVVEGIPLNSVWIVDGMAMLQEIPQKAVPGTFGELSECVIQQLVRLAHSAHCDTVHFVVDTYRSLSIKAGERGRRAASGSQLTKIYGTEQKVPNQWKKFLSCSQNKEALIRFLFKTWKENPTLLHDIKVILAHDEECHSLQNMDGTVKVVVVRELECNHEEADTRLFLHCQYAAASLPSSSSSTPTVIIKSPDTDVFVIGVAKADQIQAQLLFHTGRGNNKRTLNLTAIRSHLGDSVANALIGLHCFSGCDSTSCFYGRSKKKPLKLMTESVDFQAAFQKFGATFSVEESLVDTMEKFVCRLYDQDCTSVNTARYNKFLMGTKAEMNMPPTHDALVKHLMRANYQSAIHTRCLEQYPVIPSPHNHGWKVTDTNIEVVWGDLPPAPSTLLELTYCSCKKTSCEEPKAAGKGRCSCRQHNITCTDLCRCINCKNSAQAEHNMDEEDTDNEDED
eukprot:XP_011676157.1 PREDICTED: uncharacterized protein LOC105444073 [Strongylocentrotus purpuratus]